MPPAIWNVGSPQCPRECADHAWVCTRAHPENGASVARVLLLSEAALTEIEEKREELQPRGVGIG